MELLQMTRIDLPFRTPVAATALAAAALLVLSGCATPGTADESPPARATVANKAGEVAPSAAGAKPYPSTYVAPASPPTLIRGATVLTGTGTRLDDADVLFEGGRIAAVGRGLRALAPRRLPLARGQRARRRQRGHKPFHRAGLGRALGLATGPGV
jgi:hypothetical protein